MKTFCDLKDSVATKYYDLTADEVGYQKLKQACNLDVLYSEAFSLDKKAQKILGDCVTEYNKQK